MLTLRPIMEERIWQAIVADRRLGPAAVRLYGQLLVNPLNTIPGHAAAMGFSNQAVRNTVNNLVEHGWVYNHRASGRRGAIIVPWMPTEVELNVVASLAQLRTEILFYGEWLMKCVLDLLVKERDRHDNARPHWFTTADGNRLELDRWYRQANVAFEFQGEQHTQIDGKYVKTESDLERRRSYDQTKRDLCDHHSIKLIELTALDIGMEQIRKTVRGKLELVPLRDDSPLVRELSGMCRNYRIHHKKKVRTIPPDEMVPRPGLPRHGES